MKNKTIANYVSPDKTAIIVTFNINKGGSYQRLQTLIEGLLEYNFKITLICSDSGGLIGKYPNLMGLQFKQIPLGKTLNPFNYVLFILISTLLVPIITKKTKAKYLISFGLDLSCVFIFEKFSKSTKVITFVRGDRRLEDVLNKKSGIQIVIRDLLETIGIFASNKLIFVSNDLVTRVCKRHRKLRICDHRILNNDIPPAALSFNQQSLDFSIVTKPMRIGFIGLFEPIKGIITLVKAFLNLNTKNAELVLVGNGSLMEEIRSFSNRIKIIDWVIEPLDLMRDFDLIVVPSVYEGCSNVLLKGLGIGKPCIATNIGGNKEILFFDELLFPPNDVKALSSKLTRIIEDKQYYQKISEFCKKRKSKFIFNWKKKVIQYILES
ncbi:MAG: glycosyltransferase [Candidatus Lokiarchaeota archaeon]|nr:glycosyltransferase [Candidatus Lokiarchaeota archaeon]